MIHPEPEPRYPDRHAPCGCGRPADDIKAAQKTADQAKAAIVTTNQKVANIETSVDGLKMNLSETTTDLHGLVEFTSVQCPLS